MIALSGKARFLKQEAWANKHRELVVSDSFLRALECAKDQYQRNLSLDRPVPDMATSAAMFQRIIGVEGFIEVLLNLAEAPKPADRKRDPTELEPTD